MHGWWEGWPDGIVGVLFELGMGLRGCWYGGLRAVVLMSDEPESLILAQSERWRHA